MNQSNPNPNTLNAQSSDTEKLIAVTPTIYQSKEDFEGNMLHDEARDQAVSEEA